MARGIEAFSARPAFQLYLDVNQVGQNIEQNYSTVNIQLRIQKVQASPSYSFNNSTWYVNAAGVEWRGNFTFDFRNSDTLLLFATDMNIWHNADGQQSISVDSDVNAALLGNAGPVMAIGLSTIPRATQPSLQYPTINAGDTQVVNLPRASGSFTHAIQLFYGNTASTVAQGAGDRAEFVVPMDMLRQTPSNTIGNGFVRAITYQGGTQIGYKDTPIAIQAAANIVPSFSTVTVAEANSSVASLVGAFVKTLSRLSLAITNAQGIYGSTISSYQIRISSQASVINAASGTSSNLTTAGTVTITGRVTDSRGRWTEKSVTITVLDYSPPAISSANAQRATSTGVVNEQGAYVKATMAMSVKTLSVNGVQKNVLTYTLLSRLRGTEAWKTEIASNNPGGISFNSSRTIGPGFGIEQAYEFRLEVSDRFATSAIQLVIATAQIFMHWDAKLGVGFGKFRERGTIDAIGDIYHRDGGIVQPAGMVVPYAGTTSPAGWLICNGGTVNRVTYAALFAVIGTLYGAGDGSTTFTLPNLKMKMPIGANPNGGGPGGSEVGDSVGSNSHTHFEGDLAAAIGATASNVNTIAYQAGAINPRGPKSVGSYTLGVSNAASDSRVYNHHTRVYGTTGEGSSIQASVAMQYLIKT